MQIARSTWFEIPSEACSRRPEADLQPVPVLAEPRTCASPSSACFDTPWIRFVPAASLVRTSSMGEGEGRVVVVSLSDALSQPSTTEHEDGIGTLLRQAHTPESQQALQFVQTIVHNLDGQIIVDRSADGAQPDPDPLREQDGRWQALGRAVVKILHANFRARCYSDDVLDPDQLIKGLRLLIHAGPIRKSERHRLLCSTSPSSRWSLAGSVNVLSTPPPQASGWQHISTGVDTLIAAPTGSGKTLAAFLWSIDRLVRKVSRAPWPVVHVVYVSPLKPLAGYPEKSATTAAGDAACGR